jgi:hypothetical protein
MDRSVRVQVAEEGADDERLDEVTGYLREELKQLDVGGVSPVRVGEAPDGTRALDVIAVGGLLVSVANSQALRSVVSAVRRWLSRGQGTPRSVRMEIDGDVLELSGASEGDQERLVEMFLTRHGST